MTRRSATGATTAHDLRQAKKLEAELSRNNGSGGGNDETLADVMDKEKIELGLGLNQLADQFLPR